MRTRATDRDTEYDSITSGMQPADEYRCMGCARGCTCQLDIVPLASLLLVVVQRRDPNCTLPELCHLPGTLPEICLTYA